jgi:choline dehydrogenase-like flavoprotein
VWTGGVYPLHDGELADFPFGHAELAPGYEEVARRIGIGAAEDDLARFMPLPAARQEPLALDAASARLLAAYERRRAELHAAGCFAGRSRVAVLSAPEDDRGECTYLGRCLLGCPRGALYTPSLTLARLLAEPEFRYLPGAFVSHCVWDRTRRVTGVVVAGPDGGEEVVPAELVALAAGALSSARIALDSVRRATGEILVLDGLMDNQQLLVPFLHLGSLGRAVEMRSYPYHQLCLGLVEDDPRDYVHVQLTTLKTAIVHPILARLPGGLVGATRLFRLVRGALGVANVNLADTRRRDCTATIEPRPGAPSTLVLDYRPAAGDGERGERARRRVAWVLGRLGCLAPRAAAHVRPKGASVHYAGLVPMGGAAAPLTASAEGESREVRGLVFADGVTFPFLPAKNLTYTLMANAVRIANALL